MYKQVILREPLSCSLRLPLDTFKLGTPAYNENIFQFTHCPLMTTKHHYDYF